MNSAGNVISRADVTASPQLGAGPAGRELDMTIDRPPDAVGQVVAMIYQQFAEPITVADMARSVRYSRFHFSREFQRATGVTPGRFLTAVRMQEAKRLLLTTSLTVGEVAARVGYSSVGTFSARFKTTVGFSPTTYRAVAFEMPGARPGAETTTEDRAVETSHRRGPPPLS